MTEKEAIKVLNIASGKTKGVHVYKNTLIKAIGTVLNLLEKKDKMIDLMAEELYIEMNCYANPEEVKQDYAYIEDGYYNWLLSDGTDMSFLNEEVELIEDEVDIDNIEKVSIVNTSYKPTPCDMKFIAKKFNELISALKQINKEIKSIKEK